MHFLNARDHRTERLPMGHPSFLEVYWCLIAVTGSAAGCVTKDIFSVNQTGYDSGPSAAAG